MKRKQQRSQKQQYLNLEEVSIQSNEAKQKLRQIGLSTFISNRNDQFQQWDQPKKTELYKRRIRTASCDVRQEKQFSCVRQLMIPSKINPHIHQQSIVLNKNQTSKGLSGQKKQKTKRSYSNFVYKYKSRNKQQLDQSQSTPILIFPCKLFSASRELFFKPNNPTENLSQKKYNIKQKQSKNVTVQSVIGTKIHKLQIKSPNKTYNLFVGKKIRLKIYSKDKHMKIIQRLKNTSNLLEKDNTYSSICHLKGSSIKFQRKQILKSSRQTVVL